MEVVKMIALVAGEEVFMGECHPARARVLVKKELASWKDGKLLLHVLSVHDKILANNPEAIYGPQDKGGVSKAELERRLAWFRSFMTTSTKVLAQMARPLPSLEEALRWAGPPVDAEGDSCVEIEVEEVPLTEEDRLFYEDTSEAPDPEVELRDFWMASDVGRYYGITMSEDSVEASVLACPGSAAHAGAVRGDVGAGSGAAPYPGGPGIS